MDFTDFLSQQVSSPELDLHSQHSQSDISQLQDQSIYKTYLIQDQLVKLPKIIQQIDLTEILTVNLWSEYLTQQDKQQLCKLLPQFKINQTIQDLLTFQIFHITNPIKQFTDKLKRGIYNKQHAKIVKMRKALWQNRLYQYTSDLKQSLPQLLSTLNYQKVRSEWVRRKLAYYRFQSDEQSEDSILSVNFQGCSSGVQTLIDQQEEALYQISERNRRNEQQGKQNELKKAGNLDWIKYSSRFKDVRIHKNQITVKLPSTSWVQNYRRQELQRYKSPLTPWAYQMENSTSIVAPVSKKLVAPISSTRDNQYLKRERPPFVSLSSLVRDAAARLPDGVGTRADISQLVRDSQYLLQNISDTQLNNLVNTILERFHYQKDPCVKYEDQRKLWVYLHRGRGVDYPAWKCEIPVKRGRPAQQIVDSGPKEFLPSYLEVGDEIRKKRCVQVNGFLMLKDKV